MDELADLEILLRRKDSGRYLIEIVFTQPGSDAEVQPLDRQVVAVAFDDEALTATLPDYSAYGKLLGAMLLADEAARKGLAAARMLAQTLGLRLRLRLAIAADSPELHNLHWETLTLPGESLPISMSDQVVFTRTVSSADWKPVKLRAKDHLRALIVIAAPDNLAEFQLAPIDVAAERQRATRGMGLTISATVLTTAEQTSLAALTAALREGYDIVYLIAHGTMADGEPQLCLNDGTGKVAWVAGDDLVARFSDLVIRPRLVVLAACESAGAHAQETLRAIGPRMTIAGIPAVLAMQSQLSLEAHAIFAPTFLRELAKHGQIDRALSDARQMIADTADWWVPTLYTRLRSGKIWYEPGFDEQKDFTKWPTLLDAIYTSKCTPILGPGLLDSYIGSTRELARRLAEEHNFPLAPYARDDLPQVAQFLAVNQDRNFLQNKLRGAFLKTLAARANLPETQGRDVDEVLSEVSRAWRATNPDEIHNVLARLPFPIYLTANPDSLLLDALAERKKEPYAQLCPWNGASQQLQEAQDHEKPPPVEPTVQQPLVYRLFGRLDRPETLVLTEDDYFSYLIGVTRNEQILPPVIDSALVDSALLFLGFKLDDWNFRVLFQSVVNLAGVSRLEQYTHVAVQIDPQEEAFLNPDAARVYLKSRFGIKSLKLTIFWGSAEDFIRILVRQSSALGYGHE